MNTDNIVQIGTALKWRNTYDPDKTYYQENVVTACGSVFVCKALQSQGQPPMGTDDSNDQGHAKFTNTDIWDVMVDALWYYNLAVDSDNRSKETLEYIKKLDQAIKDQQDNIEKIEDNVKQLEDDYDSMYKAIQPLYTAGLTDMIPAFNGVFENDTDALANLEYLEIGWVKSRGTFVWKAEGFLSADFSQRPDELGQQNNPFLPYRVSGRIFQYDGKLYTVNADGKLTECFPPLKTINGEEVTGVGNFELLTKSDLQFKTFNGVYQTIDEAYNDWENGHIYFIVSEFAFYECVRHPSTKVKILTHANDEFNFEAEEITGIEEYRSGFTARAGLYWLDTVEDITNHIYYVTTPNTNRATIEEVNFRLLNEIEKIKRNHDLDIEQIYQAINSNGGSGGGFLEFDRVFTKYDFISNIYLNANEGKVVFVEDRNLFYRIVNNENGEAYLETAGDDYNGLVVIAESLQGVVTELRARAGFYITISESKVILYKVTHSGTAAEIEEVYTESKASLEKLIKSLIPEQDQGANIPTVYFTTQDAVNEYGKGIDWDESRFEDNADAVSIYEALKDGFAVVNLVVDGGRGLGNDVRNMFVKLVTFVENDVFLTCEDIIFSFDGTIFLANINLEMDEGNCVRSTIELKPIPSDSEIAKLKASIENLERIVAPN